MLRWPYYHVPKRLRKQLICWPIIVRTAKYQLSQSQYHTETGRCSLEILFHVLTHLLKKLNLDTQRIFVVSGIFLSGSHKRDFKELTPEETRKMERRKSMVRPPHLMRCQNTPAAPVAQDVRHQAACCIRIHESSPCKSLLLLPASSRKGRH